MSFYSLENVPVFTLIFVVIQREKDKKISLSIIKLCSGSTVISVGSISPSNDQEKDDGPPVIVCGISLARFGRNVQFVLCSSAILFFFVLYGYLQEFIFAYGDFKLGFEFTIFRVPIVCEPRYDFESC